MRIDIFTRVNSLKKSGQLQRIVNDRILSFITACLLITGFVLLERFHYTLPVFFRGFRSFLAGPLKTAHPWWRR